MSVTLEHKAQLYHQLYVGIKAGLPLHIATDPSLMPPSFQTPQLAAIPKLLQKGRPLSGVLAYAKVITPWEAKVLKIGEDAGRLDGVLADMEAFFIGRLQQYKAMRAKLIYPAVVFLVGVLAGPAPALAAGAISVWQFLFGASVKFAVLYTLYRVLIVRTFEQAEGPMSPLMVALALRKDSSHWLRQYFEVSYLNLLVLCLGSGIDAVSSLKTMQEMVPDKRLYLQHGVAASQVMDRGITLTQALVGSGIIQNYEIGNFLNTSEKSGSLHSDMKQYLARRNSELFTLLKHKATVLSRLLYVLVLIVTVALFMQSMGKERANPFTPHDTAAQR